MNEKAIQQMASAVDSLFGRPGSAQVALAHIDMLNAFAESVRAAQKSSEQKQERPNG